MQPPPVGDPAAQVQVVGRATTPEAEREEREEREQEDRERTEVVGSDWEWMDDASGPEDDDDRDWQGVGSSDAEASVSEDFVSVSNVF